jgi:oligosaccharide repeat unit polymerase
LPMNIQRPLLSPLVLTNHNLGGFDCWPEISLTAVLCVLAFLVTPNDALVAIAGLAIVVSFLTRLFVSDRLSVFDIRTLAVLGYGIWMFLGLFRYAVGIDAPPPIVECSDRFVNRTALYEALGFLAMLWGLQHSNGRKISEGLIVRRTLSSRQLHWISGILLIACTPYHLFHNNFFGFRPEIPFYYGIVAPLVHPALIMLTYLVSTDPAYAKSRKVSIYGFCVLGFTLLLAEVSRRPLVTVALAAVFILGYYRNQFPSCRACRSYGLSLVLGVLLFIGLYTVGTAMRAVSFSDGTYKDFIQQLDQLHRVGQSYQDFFLLEFVMENYPDQYPYTRGASFLNLAASPVPRVIWPSKPIGYGKEIALRMAGIPPSVHYSRKLDRRIGYQSYSGTLLGEGYANFGWVGGLVLLFLFGRIVAFIHKYLEQNPRNQFAVVLYACFLSAALIQQRGDLQSVNFDTIHAVGIFLLLLALVGRRYPRHVQLIQGTQPANMPRYV